MFGKNEFFFQIHNRAQGHVRNAQTSLAKFSPKVHRPPDGRKFAEVILKQFLKFVAKLLICRKLLFYEHVVWDRIFRGSLKLQRTSPGIEIFDKNSEKNNNFSLEI